MVIAVAILLGFLPGFAWLVFYLQEDVHPEPKKIIAKVFFAGALMTIAVLLVQYAFDYFFRFLFREFSFVPMVTFAAIEEIFKFLAAYLVLKKSKFFDEPVDAMIYMITAALGLATLENVIVLLGISINGSFTEILGTVTLRFIGATLLHSLSSGIVGYYWARGFVKKAVGKYIIIGLIIAIILHTIFNYIILLSNADILVYPTIFLVIVAFFLLYDFEKLKRNPNIRMGTNEMNKH